MHPFRTFVVALLLAALPLQGLAAFAPAMDCADAHAAHGSGHPDHSATDGASAHDHHAPADSGSADAAGGHSCCHHVATAVTPGGIAGMPESPQTLIVGVRSLATLFIPELPQRPPRA
jgi:hypothetical protein